MSIREKRSFTLKATQVVWYLAGLIEALLAMRFVLKLIAANPNNGFAAFIYDLSGLFLLPFFGLTITPSVGGVVMEFHTVIAMLVYALAAWGVQQLIEIVVYPPHTGVTVERDTYIETPLTDETSKREHIHVVQE